MRSNKRNLLGAALATLIVCAAHSSSAQITLTGAGKGAVVAGIAAPNYLATVSTAPYAAYGAQRVVAGYAGPLYQLQRASDNATMDVYAQSGGDYPNYASVVSWIGASTASVATIYDQSGNARNLTQATIANQPSIDPTQKTGNVVPILIDGYGRSSSGGLPQAQIAKTLSVGGLSLDLISNSIFVTMAPKVSRNNSAIVQGTDNGVATGVEQFFGNGSVTVRVNSSNESNSNGVPRFSIDTLGFTMSATQSVIYDRGATRTTGHTLSSTAIPRLTLGTSITGSTAYNGMFKLFGMVVYPATLNSTDGASVVAGMNTAFAVPSAYDYALLFTGDSIMEGSGGLLLRSTPEWVQEGLTKRVEIFNTAIHGQTLATDYAARTAAATLYRSGVTNVAFIEGGTNDLTAGTTGANLYTNTTTPYVSYLKGLGYKVVVCTLTPRADSSATTSIQTERLNYNSAVTGNAAGADYVLDQTQNPVMGDASGNVNSTTYYTDKLHPTALGYRYLAGAASGTYAGTYTYYYALKQVLVAVSAGYAP